LNKQVIFFLSAIVILIASNIFLWVQVEKNSSRNDYHRSRMFEYELLANFNRIFPVGTPLEKFLNDLKINRQFIRKSLESGKALIFFRPSLRIPSNEQKDYTGFTAVFGKGALLSIHPSGPQPQDVDVNLPELPLNTKIQYYQRL